MDTQARRLVVPGSKFLYGALLYLVCNLCELMGPITLVVACIRPLA